MGEKGIERVKNLFILAMQYFEQGNRLFFIRKCL